jgi:hypothetical protein
VCVLLEVGAGFVDEAIGVRGLAHIYIPTIPVNYSGLANGMLLLLGSDGDFWNNPPSRKD